MISVLDTKISTGTSIISGRKTRGAFERPDDRRLSDCRVLGALSRCGRANPIYGDRWARSPQKLGEFSGARESSSAGIGVAAAPRCASCDLLSNSAWTTHLSSECFRVSAETWKVP